MDQNKICKKGKQIASLFLTLVMLLTLLPASAFAVEATPQVQNACASLSDDFPDDNALFAGYVQKVFYGDSGIAMAADYGSKRLSGLSLALYRAIKEKVMLVANGTLTSTEFTFTRAELGIDQAEWANFDWLNASTTGPVFQIVSCLLVDCPYELYWFDKVNGWVWDPSNTKVSFQFFVTKDYSASNAMRTTTTNGYKTSAAPRAAANARQIVADYANRSDKEKLTAYRDVICDLVSYNYDATYPSYEYSYGYGNPWQLIYVFDGDPSTDVVCEGYSKAFQYLCDNTQFQNSITCYTVTGKMNGGDHMWNIVKMDNGQNYLVDVTNCDDDSGDGGSDELFLRYDQNGGSVSQGYQFFAYDSWISYVYNIETLSLFHSDVLRLATTMYQEMPPIPTGLRVHIGNKLSSVRLPGNWTWNDADQIISEAGLLPFAATYTPSDEDADRYSTVTLDLTVNVENHSGQIRNKKDATWNQSGYTGDMVCTICGEVLHRGMATERLADACSGGRDCPSNHFDDVDSSQWYHAYVDYVVDHSVMNGVGGDAFQPNASLTRAMMVQILYNLEGRPVSVSHMRFTDVSSGSWYKDAIDWASEVGVVKGYSDTIFAPGDRMTREQMAAMLYRYANFKGYDTTARTTLSGFSDAGRVSAYAEIPMQWAAATMLVQGMGDGTLGAGGNATRAQIATVLMRYCESIAG